jgi:hypothetical protein
MSNGSNESDESNGSKDSDGKCNTGTPRGERMQRIDESYDSCAKRQRRRLGSRRRIDAGATVIQ